MANDEDGEFIPARRVRKRYDDISDMTLWRWIHDAELNFPKPCYLGRQRFWRLNDLKAWEMSRASVPKNREAA